MRWEATEDGLSFVSDLPKRYGAIGWTAHGLMASGGWTPQPMIDGKLPVVSWTVTVALPGEAVGALGGSTGTGLLTWSGEAERAPLAVLPRGQVTSLRGDDWALSLVHRRRHRTLQRELTTQLDRYVPTGSNLTGAAVVAPLRRRLARPSPELAYISDRAFRLTGLQRFHRVAVTRGVGSSLLPLSDPYLREVAGAGLSLAHAERLRGDDAERLLQRFQWLPLVNSLLSSRRMPFYGDVLELTHPADPVMDDLIEALAPTTAGTVVAAQLDDTFGEGTAAKLGRALAEGQQLSIAAPAAGLAPSWLGRWQHPYPRQDYRLDVTDEAVHLTRDAPPGSPDETLTVRIDGIDHVRTGPPGSWTIPLESPARQVVVDPLGHVKQTSRVDDAYPRRYQVTASAGISSVNLTRLQLSGAALTTLRRRWDTRNLWTGQLATNRTTLVRASAGYRRKLGELLDGWTRPLRIGGSVGVSVWSPWYADVDITQPGVDTSAFVTWDDRVSGDFPLRGKRASLYGELGVVPASGATWQRGGVAVSGLLPLHPRHAVAARSRADLARSDVPHRLLPVGNPGVMVSVPALPACAVGQRFTEAEPCSRLADRRAIATLEYRAAIIRNASVPLGLAWGSELQLALGTEALVARLDDGDSAWATGLTVGVTGIGDILGAEPTQLGVTAGWPVAWSGLEEVSRTTVPDLYVRWAQRF